MRHARMADRHAGAIHYWHRPDGRIFLTLHASLILDHVEDVHVATGWPLNQSAWLRVPPEALAALKAGADPEPVLDYLIEAHGAAHPWLADAVAGAVADSGRSA